jgi:hypothetical protein
MMKIIITISAILLIAQTNALAQFHLFAGPSIGKFRFHQGPSDTRAWVFNNYTNVTKPMEPNKNISGINVGANLTITNFVFGLEYCTHKNTFGGTALTQTTDYTTKFNGIYVNFGIGNRVDNSKNQSLKSMTKLIYRMQFSYGWVNFKYAENAKGIINSDKTLGAVKVSQLRISVPIVYKLTKKFNIQLVPYYQFDDEGGYIELLQESLTNAQIFNIANYGLKLNFDYGL